MGEAVNKSLALDDSVKVNNKGEAILGRLEGPCADFIDATRNGRQYDESLWDKVFNRDIVKEYFECGGIPGELDHPSDRLETCSEKIAIMMPEPPKKNSEGKLIAKFDILDTPCGRIAHTLAKYGYKLGISSRGSGETFTDMDGKEHVDEDTYDFQAFDLVLLPAVKTARLKLVTESLNTNSGFKQALAEALNKSSDSDKKIMQETLNNLNICLSENNSTSKAANYVGADVVKELQTVLKENRELKDKITSLQEKLSVCYAKEVDNDKELSRYKSATVNLSESVKSAKALKSRVAVLEETVARQNRQLDIQSSVIKSLKESKALGGNKVRHLTENLKDRDSRVTELQRQVKMLKESNSRDLDAHKKNEQTLLEKIADLEKDSTLEKSNYSSKLEKANKLTEKYRNIAKQAVEKYISSQALRIGVTPNEIKNRLSENYSFKDIDKICEDLKEYKLNISKLPFDVSSNSKVKVAVKESVETIAPGLVNEDDAVDDQLLELAGIK